MNPQHVYICDTAREVVLPENVSGYSAAVNRLSRAGQCDRVSHQCAHDCTEELLRCICHEIILRLLLHGQCL